MKTKHMTTLHLRNSIGRSPLRLGLPRVQPIWIIRGFLLIPLVLAWFALSPSTRAVLPAPDGGYANNNTAEGDDALFSLFAGSNNTANGYQALYSNINGSNNTANGYQALYSNINGTFNTASGVGALRSNTTGHSNTANGDSALYHNTTGYYNTATGLNALYSNTTGFYNTANGLNALYSNTTGARNTANGVYTLFSNTTGSVNTATGLGALYSNTGGYHNTANGYYALYSNTTSNSNTAEGYQALQNNTGSDNTGLGVNAGLNLTTGSQNIDIGNSGVAGEANTMRIGRAANQTRAFIAGIAGVAVTGSAVLVSSGGQLGVAASSARFKQNIQAMGEASDQLLTLKPVTFRYRPEIDPEGIPQFGLVAEDVEKINPALVTRDAKGHVYTVRYEAVNAMLLNEFLKEHRKNEEQEATIARQQKQIEALAAGLQKVSAQVEMSRRAPEMASST